MTTERTDVEIDPKTLTTEQVAELTGAELDAAVERYVFGDSLEANTEERLEIAVSDAWGTFIVDPAWKPWVERFHREILSSDGRSIWRDREGKPYQAALEAHVAAWRATPPVRTVAELLTLDSGLSVRWNGVFQVTMKDEALGVKYIRSVAEGDSLETALKRALLIRKLEQVKP